MLHPFKKKKNSIVILNFYPICLIIFKKYEVFFFFFWTRFNWGLNMSDNLHTRIPISYLSPNCYMPCKIQNETSEHIFLHCLYTKAFWYRNLASHIIQSTYLNELLSQFLSLSKKHKDVLRSNIIRAILWSIWIERNSKIFKDVAKNQDLSFSRRTSSNYLPNLCTKLELFCNYDAYVIFLNWMATLDFFLYLFF